MIKKKGKVNYVQSCSCKKIIKMYMIRRFMANVTKKSRKLSLFWKIVRYGDVIVNSFHFI